MKRIAYITLLILLVGIFSNCEKFEVNPTTKVETGTATPQATSITVNAKIIDLSGEGNTDHGFCYATHSEPTIDDFKVSKGNPKVGDFTGSIDGLALNTEYYIRAYCQSAEEIVYGKEVAITTLNGEILLTTDEVTDITTTTATSGGNITSDGGLPVTVRGVVWSKSQDPTITNNQGITSNGTGTGSFTSNITSLQLEMVYYVRSYATNSYGTQYGNQVSFTSMPDGPGGAITDVDGNTYNTIWINGRQWMKENLKTTKYSDESNIPNVTDDATWAELSTPAYCWYGNDEATYGGTYGALYNWYAVSTGNLCPTGWHVPTDEEWTSLTDYVGGVSVAGTKLKATDGWVTGGNGTDEYGFSALPGGLRNDYGGHFNNLRVSCYWWSSTEIDATLAWSRDIYYTYVYVDRRNSSKGIGGSVRCVRDN